MKTIKTGILLASLFCAPMISLADEGKPNGPFVLPLLDNEQRDEKARSESSKSPMRPDEPGDYCDFKPLTG